VAYSVRSIGVGLVVLAALVVAISGIVAYRSAKNPVANQIELDSDLNALDRNVSTGKFDFSTEVSTTSPQSLLGFVGMIAERPKGGSNADMVFIGDFRPGRDKLDVIPYTTKLFEGIVTKKASAHGDYASFAGNLATDEAAEALIESTLSIEYKDNSEIPWKQLRALKLDPANDYYFVDSVVLVQTSVRKYKKTKGGADVKGLAFSSGGDFYVASSEFEMRDRLALRALDLRALLPTEAGVEASTISEILGKSEIDEGDAKKLTSALRQRTDLSVLKGVPTIALKDIRTGLKSEPPIGVLIQGVLPLRQKKDRGCWATVGAMLEGWKEGKHLTPEDFLSHLGAEWLAVYTRNEGLGIDRRRRFLDAAHFRYELGGETYLADGVANMLRTFGPLWFTTSSGVGFSSHALLVVGVRRATSGKETITYIDPAFGGVQEEDYWHFVLRYEKYAADLNAVYLPQMMHDYRGLDFTQVVHF
jgi:hypothetical protein